MTLLNQMIFQILFFIFVTGLCGAAAQVTLIRELLVTFSGNELSIGIILSGWLLLEACGAYIGGKIVDRISDKILPLLLLTVLFSLFLPLNIYLARIFKTLAGIPSGQGAGISLILSASYILLAPVSILHGALFVFSSRTLPAEKNSKDISSFAGRAYIWETAGTVAGGLLATLFFYLTVNSFSIALFCSALPLLPAAFIACTAESLRRRYYLFVLAGLFIFLLYFHFSGNSRRLHFFSAQKQSGGQELVEYRNTLHGNISVTHSSGEYTLYLNGTPAITENNPDTEGTELFVHFTVLSHPFPGNALTLSGGAGGMISELLKYKTIKEVDYVELDREIIETLRRYAGPDILQELNDRRVTIHNTDPRYFVRNPCKKYDTVFIGSGDPDSLLDNRLYTAEFFSELKIIMSESSVGALETDSSESYLTEAAAKLNLSIIGAIKKNFSFIRIIPGERNLIIFSDNINLSETGPELLYSRLIERKIPVKVLSRSYIMHRLDNYYLNRLMSELGKRDSPPNSDFKPSSLYYSLSIWNSKFSPGFQKIFAKLENLALWQALFIYFIIFAGFALAARCRTLKETAVINAVFSTGYTGMILYLVLIFGFQAVTGNIFYLVGILLSSFMLGNMAGAKFASKFQEYRTKTFVYIETASAMLCLGTILFFSNIRLFPESAAGIFPFFLVLCFLSGFIPGLEFPIAVSAKAGKTEKPGKAIGLVYSADLAGGWAAGILCSIVFFPVLGIIPALMIAFILKLFGALFLLSAFKKLNHNI